MAALFQIRRGTSGSLDNGELFYNTTSQSLQLGNNTNTDVITLTKLNETNSGSFKVSGDISASGNLFISGNARIVGNLTFGDSNAIDTVTVVASLSSSLIPQSNSTFDLGNTTTYWKTAYITSITGSLSGSVNGTNITTFSASVSSSIGNLNNSSASYQLRINALEQNSGSVNSFTASITSSYNATSQSLTNVSASLLNVSSSYIATSQSLNNVSASLLTFSSSQYKNDSSSVNTRVTNLESTSSILTSFSASVSTSVGLLQTFSSSVNNRVTSIESYTSSLKTAIELTGSSVTIQGDLLVRGTTTTINATTINLSASVIQVDAGGAVDGGIEVTDKIGASNITGSLLWDVSGDYWKAGKKGSEIQIGTTTDISNLSASLYFTDTTQSVSQSIVSASAWGAFQSASSYSQSVYNTLYFPTTGLSASLSSGSQYQVNVLSASVYDAIFAPSPTALSYSIHQNIYGDGYSTTGLSGSISSSISQLSSSVSTSIYNNVWSNVSSVSQSIASASAAYSSSVSKSLYELIYFPYTGLSASFDTRISASTLTHNDTFGQTGIDFTHIGTQVSAIVSGLTTTSNVKFNNITSSNNISSSGTVYCDTLVATTLVGATLPVLQYTTQGTLGNILIKGDTSKSIHVIDTITFTGITENAGNSSQASGLLMTGSITASAGFSGSINGIGNVTLYSSSVDSNILINSQSAWGAFQSASAYSSSLATSISASKAEYTSFSASAVAIFATTGSNTFSGSQNIKGDITASGNLYVSGTIYTYELHTIIESSSIIKTSGSTFIGDEQTDILTITGSLLQTGSTSFSELTGSLFAFSSSLNSRIGTVSVGTLSASIYQTDATQSNNITIVSASAWGAYTSASSYSGSFYTTINNTTASVLINSQSAWGAFQSASSYSGSFYTTINIVIGNVTTAQNSANGAYASASAYSSSAYTTYAKLGVINTFTQNQIISGSLSVTGDVTAYATSDERLKDNIELISNPIQKVQQLRGVEFDWNDKSMFKAGKHDYGVIAQDVQKVLPELVKESHTGYLGVDYDKIIGLLIEVVKEQEKRIKDLENKVSS